MTVDSVRVPVGRPAISTHTSTPNPGTWSPFLQRSATFTTGLGIALTRGITTAGYYYTTENFCADY
ncbi:MAG: hypothetical protein F6K62_27170 [Sphaerospermopsis sp. SIO1G2]|nr:hypothetical protein [Sphaerospermopsis sp. SIO1G2]